MRLLTWRTTAMVAALVQLALTTANAAVSRDAEGWTVITPSSDSRVVYVSSSQGNDSNDGLSPSTPKKTITAANALLRDGYPDHMLLRRGDVFQPETTGTLLGRWKNGRNAQEPMLMSYYGSSGARPQVILSGALIHHNGQSRSYQAFTGIEFYKSNSDPNSPDFTNVSSVSGFAFIGGGEHILIEDCLIRFLMITFDPFCTDGYSYVTLRRNIVLDSWTHNALPVSGNHSRIQGLYVSETDHFVLEENFFDHNGWSDHLSTTGRNMYNHNVYIQYSLGEGSIIRGNISARGAAHGIQARSGGLCDRNLLIQNAVGMNIGGLESPTDYDVYFFPNRGTENVVISGQRMDPNGTHKDQTPAVYGLDSTIDIPGTLLEDNIVANREHSGSNQSYLGASWSVHLNNISYAWQASVDTPNPGGGAWPHPNDDMGDYYSQVSGLSNRDTEDYLNWLRTRGLRQMPWAMTAYAGINYIREGFGRGPISGYYGYQNSSNVAVTGIDLDLSTMSLSGRQALPLTTAITPVNATNQHVTFTSSNPSVATVDQYGLVTGVAPGTATITATTASGNHTDTCVVTVSAAPVTGVTVEAELSAVPIDSTTTVTAYVEPYFASARDVVWTSSNSSIASVSVNGVVTGISPGTATITATTVQGNYTDSVSIVVEPLSRIGIGASVTATAGNASGLVDNLPTECGRWRTSGSPTFPQSATIDLGSTEQIKEFRIFMDANPQYRYTISVSTNGSSYTQVVDNSNNSTSVSQINHPITTVSARYVRLAIVGAGGGAGDIRINELEIYKPSTGGSFVPVTGVSVTPASASLTISQTQQLAATVSPSNATNQGVNWSSSNNSVATVSSTGLVTAVANGSAVITATTQDGSYTDTTSITVSSGSSGGNGTITRDYWTGISGTAVSDLTSNSNFPNNPTGWDTLSSFQAFSWSNPSVTSNWADGYGQRVYGYLHPPATGTYTFWISSDDYSELYISTDSNPANSVLVATVPGWTNPLTWNKYGAQKSAAITLQAGQVYYIEALHKEQNVGDHLAVGWAKPGQSTSAPSEIVPGSALSAWGSLAPTTGSINRDYWTGITGTGVANLTSHADYPNNPTGSDSLNSFQAVSWSNPSVTSNWADNYGQRVFGFLHPPTTGNYVFWISSDDYSELYLSTDANPANSTLIATVPGWTNELVYNKYPAQKSAAITLQAGQIYYIEAIHKESTVGDHLSVGWAKPGESTTAPSEIIPGSALSQ